jgi:hypothetical protein
MQQERIVHLPAFCQELKRLAGLGYCYEKTNLRWRHVLLDAESEVFLCDLESLVPARYLGVGCDVENMAYEQLRVLLNPEIHSQSVMQDILAAQLKEVKSDYVSITSRFRDDTVLWENVGR